MAPRTLYLIDGHAQIYRAYYAPFRPLTSPTGEPTRAVHVFLQMFLGLLRDRRPDHVAMVMDVADETVFRVEIDPAYKATRQPIPEDLPSQIDRIVEILTAIRVPILRQAGFEADDLLATLCERLAGPDLLIHLVSRDKDLDQLLGPHVRMYDPMKDVETDVEALRREKGYGPEQAVEAQMLIGDTTDNIQGVPGVGPKKAAQLLQKYGTIESILAHADELTPKLRENLLAFRERMNTVRQLVTLRRDVPLEFRLEDAEVGRFQLPAARPILAELGLARLLERMGGQPPLDQGPPASPTLPEAAATGEAPPKAATAAGNAPDPAAFGTLFAEQPAMATEHGDEAPSLFDSSGLEYRLVDSEDALRDLARTMRQVAAFAFDTETTGLGTTARELVGISVSWAAGTGHYVPVRGVGRTLSVDLVRETLGPIFADPAARKSGHNLKFDLLVLRQAGFEVAGLAFDSMLASFVLDSARPSHGLDALAYELLRERKMPISELIGRGRNQRGMHEAPTDRVAVYAARDADLTWRLWQVMERQLSDPELAALFRDLDMPLLEVLARMEETGVALDTARLAALGEQMAERLRELEAAIHHEAGRPFNINSTRQLAEVLFDERKLPVVKRTRTTRSTDAEVLETLAADTGDPIPRLVLEHRELSKLKGTYVDALPALVSPRTGRIHPSFNQIGAVTGRLSCNDPNLQNIPIRTELGAQIRRAFVPGEPGWVLLKADYSQIELRVLAHFCGDEALAAAFHEDRDIHAFVAAQIEGVPLEQVTKAQRSQAKTVNFGIIYGQSAFGLSRQTGMPVGQAKEFIERYFRRYPRIRVFLDECVAQARRTGYVKTLLGRRRAIADIRSPNQTVRSGAERLAVNTVIQGTAADLIKRAMINIDRRLRTERRPSRMLIQVHDELVFETPEAAVEDEAAMIREEMSNALKLNVPVKVDVGWGPNWLEVK